MQKMLNFPSKETRVDCVKRWNTCYCSKTRKKHFLKHQPGYHRSS